ncbi:MAG: TetR/AcrR family transcriptional regulator [Solirubrobacterales bacterium]
MSPRPQIDHIRRPQLLKAAAAVISERGVAGTRIADVAERAGTSPSAILYWFDSRDELLAEALTFAEAGFYERFAERLAGLADPRDRLVALMEAAVTGDDWILWMEFWTRALRDEHMREARQRLDDRWREEVAAIIREGVESGHFHAPDPDRAALELASLIDGLAVQVTLGDRLVTADVMRTICIEVAERLLDTELPVRAPELIA